MNGELNWVRVYLFKLPLKFSCIYIQHQTLCYIASFETVQPSVKCSAPFHKLSSEYPLNVTNSHAVQRKRERKKSFQTLTSVQVSTHHRTKKKFLNWHKFCYFFFCFQSCIVSLNLFSIRRYFITYIVLTLLLACFLASIVSIVVSLCMYINVIWLYQFKCRSSFTLSMHDLSLYDECKRWFMLISFRFYFRKFIQRRSFSSPLLLPSLCICTFCLQPLIISFFKLNTKLR